MSGVELLLAAIFVDPVRIGPGVRLLMLLPLAASVSIVYKAIRVERLRDLPLAAFVLWITIVLGMFAVGVGLYLAFKLLQ